MGRVAWNQDYSMDSKVIDSHHQLLIDYINQLDEAIEKKVCGKKFLSEIADKLLDYTDYHFTSEELYMKQYKYPELPAHCEEHKAFIDEIKKIKRMIDEDASGLDVKIIDYLRTWLLHHILIIDKEYAIFFKNQGVHLP